MNHFNCVEYFSEEKLNKTAEECLGALLTLYMAPRRYVSCILSRIIFIAHFYFLFNFNDPSVKCFTVKILSPHLSRIVWSSKVKSLRERSLFVLLFRVPSRIRQLNHKWYNWTLEVRCFILRIFL